MGRWKDGKMTAVSKYGEVLVSGFRRLFAQVTVLVHVLVLVFVHVHVLVLVLVPVRVHVHVLVLVLVLALFAPGGLRGQDREPAAAGYVELASQPDGAEVYAGDTLLGRTPIRVQRALLDSITVWYPERAAWNAQTRRPELPAVGADEGVVFLQFDARQLFLGTPAGDVRVRDDALRLPSADVLIPAGIGLVAGVAAVIFKQEADAQYDAYLRTGDELLLSQTEKYDIYAGVSLALLQIGLGYFIYRLFDE
jgi:hypothetical protein